MRTLSFLILTLFFTISVIAQPWLGNVPGNIYYNQGNVGIGTSSPQSKLDVSVLSATNENNIITNFTRDAIASGGSGIVRLNYHNACDLEINSGYSSAGHRYGEYFDFNIVNNFTGGNWGAINFVTNGISRMAIKANGNIGIGMNNPNSKVVVSDEFGTMSISSGGIGFNRNVKDGQIFNTSISAWQFQTRDDRFTLEGYNGVAHDPFTVLKNGNVGMGTISPTYKLDVIGTIRAKEIKVDLNGADFVFEKAYKLMPLTELEAFVKEQKHLPEVAPAKEMQENGTDLGNLNSKLLQKVEELTLYLIDQNKQINLLKEENKAIRNLIAK